MLGIVKEYVLFYRWVGIYLFFCCCSCLQDNKTIQLATYLTRSIYKVLIRR